jgi:hypothetical protein
MSVVLAVSCILPVASAVADSSLPVWRARPIGGLVFYRRHTLTLLRRYLGASMELGRTPCILGVTVFRARVSSRRLRTFEDLVIFVIDVENCLRQLDRVSQSVVAHMALEDCTPAQTATLLHESERTIHRIYGTAMDRLTRLFLENQLLEPPPEKLSRECAKLQSNDSTKQVTYTTQT